MACIKYLGTTLSLLASFAVYVAAHQATQTINFAAVQSPLLVGRQNSGCIPNTYMCSTSLGQAFNGFCCEVGYTCSLDAAGNPACCPPGFVSACCSRATTPLDTIADFIHLPYRAVCTGTAPSTAPAPTAAAVSYVPNPYFPFPYIPTVFANSAACASAVGQCSQNYGACVTALQGNGGFGVTVVVNGGSTVAAASAANVGTAATSICSSLSTQACSAAQTAQCAQFGNAGKRPNPTAACVAGLAAGVGVGVAVAGVW
jgi:hypothetical protein